MKRYQKRRLKGRFNVASLKKFEIGKEYTCSGLYGGEYKIKVVDRTETTVSFVYSEECSDDSSIQTKEIMVQTRTIFDLSLNELGKRLLLRR